MSEVKEFIEKLGKDPKARELLKKKEKFTTEAEALNAYVDVAKELGYDITGDDLTAAIEALEQEQKNKTEGAASAITALPDDDLKEAAGGEADENGYCTKEFWFIPTPPEGDNAVTCKNLFHKPCKHTLDRS